MSDQRTPPPLVGFNNNVGYRGLQFHIQTEDSGVRRPHIITHLFVDGGHIIKSLRTDYSEYVSHPDRQAVIQRMMREQHRAMAIELRDGRLDATIDARALAPRAARRGAPAGASAAGDGAPVGAVPADSIERASAAEQAAAVAPAALPSTANSGSSTGARGASQPPNERGQGAAPRRAKRSPSRGKTARSTATLPDKPSPESIFGVLPQESLDDVILSYLSDSELPGPPRPK